MVVPSEFSSFVRDTGIKAFDRVAGGLDDLETPLRAILRQWNKLTTQQKQSLFDTAIAAVQSPEEPAAPRPRARAAKPVKRFDPEEVAKTLPKKAKKKPKAAAAKAKKSPTPAG